jgi:hypothetical protein
VFCNVPNLFIFIFRINIYCLIDRIQLIFNLRCGLNEALILFIWWLLRELLLYYRHSLSSLDLNLSDIISLFSHRLSRRSSLDRNCFSLDKTRTGFRESRYVSLDQNGERCPWELDLNGFRDAEIGYGIHSPHWARTTNLIRQQLLTR